MEPIKKAVARGANPMVLQRFSCLKLFGTEFYSHPVIIVDSKVCKKCILTG